MIITPALFQVFTLMQIVRKTPIIRGSAIKVKAILMENTVDMGL